MDFLRLLADFRQPVLDIIFQAITYIAQETLVVVIICWLFWCQNKKLAYTLGFSYFLSGLCIQGLKITFQIPRPWVLDSNFKPVASAVSGATGYSFPSGHTQSATALFSTLGFAAQRKPWKCLCFFMFVIIGFSRMYLGVHTPKDVITSMFLSLTISALIFFLVQDKLLNSQYTGRVAAILLIICVLVTLYAGIMYASHSVDLTMGKDALKACGAGFGFAIGYYIERKFIQFELPTNTKEKILRFTFGLISVILLLLIFNYTIKRFLIGDVLSYALLVLWIVAGYPAVFSRLLKV